MPAFNSDSNDVLKRAATNAERVLKKVRAQRQDLHSNRHTDSAMATEGLDLLEKVRQSLDSLLKDVNESLADTQKNDQP